MSQSTTERTPVPSLLRCSGCGQGVVAPQLRCPSCRPYAMVLQLAAPQPYTRRLSLVDRSWVETWGSLVIAAAIATIAIAGLWF